MSLVHLMQERGERGLWWVWLGHPEFNHPMNSITSKARADVSLPWTKDGETALFYFTIQVCHRIYHPLAAPSDTLKANEQPKEVAG